MHIGQSIKKRREEKGATQEEVAFRAGTDASNLSRMERGLQKPSLDMLEQLAKALDITVSALYAMTEGHQGKGLAREAAAPSCSKTTLQAQRQLLSLTPDNQKLALEFIKLLGRLQKQAE